MAAQLKRMWSRADLTIIADARAKPETDWTSDERAMIALVQKETPAARLSLAASVCVIEKERAIASGEYDPGDWPSQPTPD